MIFLAPTVAFCDSLSAALEAQMVGGGGQAGAGGRQARRLHPVGVANNSHCGQSSAYASHHIS